MGKEPGAVSGHLVAIVLLVALCGCTASPLNTVLYGQPYSQGQLPPQGGGYYLDPTTHLVAEAAPVAPPPPSYYITNDGLMAETAPGQAIPSGAQPCDSNDESELQPGSACYAAAVREEEKESQEENDHMLQAEKEQGSQPLCGGADGWTLKEAIERVMAPAGGGPGPQVVQLSNFQMAQTTLGWACTVEVDFLGRSYQIMAYKRLPDGRYRLQTQIMGQAPLN